MMRIRDGAIGLHGHGAVPWTIDDSDTASVEAVILILVVYDDINHDTGPCGCNRRIISSHRSYKCRHEKLLKAAGDIRCSWPSHFEGLQEYSQPLFFCDWRQIV